MQSINGLSGYKINPADRWEPLKSLITRPGALLEKALTTPTASPQGRRYKALTESTKGTRDTQTHLKAFLIILILCYFLKVLLY